MLTIRALAASADPGPDDARRRAMMETRFGTKRDGLIVAIWERYYEILPPPPELMA